MNQGCVSPGQTFFTSKLDFYDINNTIVVHDSGFDVVVVFVPLGRVVLTQTAIIVIVFFVTDGNSRLVLTNSRTLGNE